MNFIRHSLPLAIVRRVTLLGASFLLISFTPVSAQTIADTGPSMPCSSTQGGSGVAIKSCSFTLQSSPAGIAYYFVNVRIEYTSPNPAVRFRCALGNGNSTVSQYGVLRASGSSLQFVSPFVSPASTLKSVACFVDASSP
jgi:hypothetical protein